MTKNQMIRIWNSLDSGQRLAAYWYLGRCNEEKDVLDIHELIDNTDVDYNTRLRLKSMDNRQMVMLTKMARNALNDVEED